ncbi:MAG: rod shape-determining protein MreC [Parcubacteria group bacterium]|nr:rod shape-determining protein MreC [Parcubacteria group bacterium]
MVRYRGVNNWIYWGGLIIVCLFFLYFGIFEFLLSFFAPLQKQLIAASSMINQLVLSNRDTRHLAARNEELEQKVRSLLIENARMQILEQENQTLKSQLNFIETSVKDRQYVIGRVIGKNLDNSSVILIDKGSRDGLIPNLPVITEEGILIGKVYEVQIKSARVLLATDPRSLIAGALLNQKKTNNLVTGRYGLSLAIEFIPRSESVKDGDIVVSSGLEEHIPRGLVIGRVEKIFSSASELFQSAIVQPAIPYDTVTIVTILLPI